MRLKMSPKTTEELVDSYLKLFNESNVVSDQQVRSHTLILLRTYDFQMEELLIILSRFGIAEERNSLGGREFVLTNFGHEVLRHGGWTKYLQDKDEEKALAREQVRSSIRTNKSQFYILVGTLILTGASVYISWLAYKKEDEDKKTNRVQIEKPALEHLSTPDTSRIILDSTTIKK